MSIMISTPLVIEPGSVTAGMMDSGTAAVGEVLTADGAGGADYAAPAGGSPGYLEYVAVVTQSGTSAPVATVLKNTLGGTVVWVRNGAGSYAGTLTGSFANGKVLVTPTFNWDLENQGAAVIYTGPSQIQVLTYDMSAFPASQPLADNIYIPGIAVRVYP